MCDLREQDKFRNQGANYWKLKEAIRTNIKKNYFFNSVKHKEKQNTTQTVAELDPMYATV